MAKLTARAAAMRLNKNERTVRRWIEQGLLAASHVAQNRYAIDETEVERIQRLQQQATRSDLERRIERVEYEIDRLSAQLNTAKATPTRSLSQAGAKNSERAAKRTPKPTGETLVTEAQLPAGSRRASEFAQAHGVLPKTFRHQMLVGRNGETVDHLAIGKPGGGAGTERWLSPEQQQATLAFWARHPSSTRTKGTP